MVPAPVVAKKLIVTPVRRVPKGHMHKNLNLIRPYHSQRAVRPRRAGKTTTHGNRRIQAPLHVSADRTPIVVQNQWRRGAVQRRQQLNKGLVVRYQIRPYVCL